MPVKPSKFSIISYILPRLHDVLFISIFVAVIGLGPRIFNVDGDLGRHITIGETILTTRQIPQKDLFSHTMPGETLTPHEWASQVVFAVLHRIAGLDGIVWFCALLLAGIFTLVYKQCIDRSGLVLVALGATILATATSSLHWLARPHLFTLFFVVIWLYGLARLQWGNPLGWWYFPVVMLLWVNFHGAFIVGFVLWGIYLLGEITNQVIKYEPAAEETSKTKPGLVIQLRNFLIVGGSSFLVTFLNPAGWRLWKTSVGYLGNRYLVSHTAEYLPPNFHDPSTWPFLAMIIASLVVLGLTCRRISATSLLMLAAWTAMSLYSVRNVPLYAVITAPILAELTAREINTTHSMVAFTALQMRLLKVETTLRGFFWPLLFVLALGFVLVQGFPLDFELQGNQFSPAIFPVEAVDWLEDNQPPGPVFNYFPWGGYLLYRLWPSELVFIDGQTDFYGEDLTREYEKVITLDGKWETILDKYQVTWVLMPTDSLLVKELNTNSSWQNAYQDRTASILIRSP